MVKYRIIMPKHKAKFLMIPKQIFFYKKRMATQMWELILRWLILLIFLFSFLPLSSIYAQFTTLNIVGSPTTKLSDDAIWSGEIVRLSYQVQIDPNTRSERYTLDYDSNYALDNAKVLRTQFTTQILPGNHNIIFELVFYIKVEEKLPPNFSGKLTLNPIPITIRHLTDPQQSKNLHIPKQVISVTDSYWYYFWSWLALGFISLVILGAGIYFIQGYLSSRQAQLDSMESLSERRERLQLEIFHAFERAGNKSQSPEKYCTTMGNLLRNFLLKVHKVSSLKEYYQRANIDSDIKQEVERFYQGLRSLSYRQGILSEEEIAKMEEDFKTLIYIA